MAAPKPPVNIDLPFDHPYSTSEHPADRHLSKEERKLQAFELKPLHILCLIRIHEGDFDKRLYQGDFKNCKFPERIGELLNMGMISYDGLHRVTPRGCQYMSDVLDVRIKP